MKLIDYLQKKDISQKEFAVLLGVSKTTLNLYINRNRRIPLHMMLAIEHLTTGQVTKNDWGELKPPSDLPVWR